MTSSKLKIQYYIDLIRFNRPIGTMLLLWPILWVFAIMDVHNISLYIVFILGAFLTRSIGCVINDVLDRNFDKKVSRTKTRPLANNKISLLEAFIILAILGFFSFILLFQLNYHTIFLGVIAGVFIILYPLSKRFFAMPQLILGIVFNFGVFMAISEVYHLKTPENSSWEGFFNVIFSSRIFLLYLSCIFWTIAYDTIYALQDREDDKKIGLKSTAIFFGSKIKLFVKKFYLISFLLLLFSVNNISNFNIFIFLIVALWALIYIFKSLKKVNVKFPARADWFFRANNYYGLLIFLAIIAGHKI